MKAIIYARVSTNDQDTQRQIDDLTKYANYKNLEVVKVFQDKISGFKKGFEDREYWNSMIEYVEKHKINNILVSELSRISRRQIDLIVFVKDCSDKGICIHTQKENIQTLNEDGSENSNAQMLISIISSMAQEESKSLSYRIKSGRANAIKNGKGFNTKIYGYKADENGRPVIDEEEAKIVRDIFKMACDGIGAPSIVNYLNEGLEDKIWKKGRVSSILKNTFYYGKMRYKGQVYDVPKIIPLQDYNKAQQLRKSRSRFTSTRQHTNPFAGMIYCKCGAKMHQRVVGLNNQYVCSVKCGVYGVNRLFLIEEIREILENNAKLSKEKEVRGKMKTKLDVEDANIKTNERELSKTKARLNRNYEMYLDGDVDKETYNKYKDKCSVQIEKLTSTIEKHRTARRQLYLALENEIEHYSNDIDIFKSQILNVVEFIFVHDKFVEVKVNGWGKQIIMIYRGQQLVKYRLFKSKQKESLEKGKEYIKKGLFKSKRKTP